MAGAKFSVIGLYGISGCGKSFTMGQLKEHLHAFSFHDGSQVIKDVMRADMTFHDFKNASEEEQTKLREQAIRFVAKKCLDEEKNGAIVAGHFSIWDDESWTEPRPIHTKADFEI